jgi:hypothetical protein
LDFQDKKAAKKEKKYAKKELKRAKREASGRSKPYTLNPKL